MKSFYIKTKINFGHFKLLFLIAAIFGLAFFCFKNSKAEIFDCDEYLKNSLAANMGCNQLSGTEKKKCEVTDKKMKANCQMTELKSKIGDNLQKTLLLIDIEQQKNQIELKKTQAKAEDLSQQIADLEQEITYKENLVKYQQLILAGLMQTYYEYDQEGVLKLVMANKNLSDVFNQGDYIEQSSDRVSEVLSSIKKEKIELQEKYDALKDKKEESERVKKELENKKANLQYTENQKQSLLTQTQGEEAKYQKLLARVEAQKLELLGDINQKYVQNSAEIEALKATLPTPDSKYTKNSSWWYYSQKDGRWGNDKIGISSSTLEDYGCALTSVAMVSTYHGYNITPKILAKKPIYTTDIIAWDLNGWKDSKISLIKNTNHAGVYWTEIDNQILSNKNPVVVFVCAKNCNTSRRAGHYVVIHNKDDKGRYVVHDPYFGPNIFLDSTMKLLGKMYGTTVSKNNIDQVIIYN